MVSDVSLEMQSDSKNYVGLQDDEITEPVHTIKSACASTGGPGYLTHFCVAYTKCIATLWYRLIYLFIYLCIYLFVYESRASVTWSSVVVLVVSLGSSSSS